MGIVQPRALRERSPPIPVNGPQEWGTWTWPWRQGLRTPGRLRLSAQCLSLLSARGLSYLMRPSSVAHRVPHLPPYCPGALAMPSKTPHSDSHRALLGPPFHERKWRASSRCCFQALLTSLVWGTGRPPGGSCRSFPQSLCGVAGAKWLCSGGAQSLASRLAGGGGDGAPGDSAGVGGDSPSSVSRPNPRDRRIASRHAAHGHRLGTAIATPGSPPGGCGGRVCLTGPKGHKGSGFRRERERRDRAARNPTGIDGQRQEKRVTATDRQTVTGS